MGRLMVDTGSRWHICIVPRIFLNKDPCPLSVKAILTLADVGFYVGFLAWQKLAWRLGFVIPGVA